MSSQSLTVMHVVGVFKNCSSIIQMSLFSILFYYFFRHYEGLPCLYPDITLCETQIKYTYHVAQGHCQIVIFNFQKVEIVVYSLKFYNYSIVVEAL